MIKGLASQNILKKTQLLKFALPHQKFMVLIDLCKPLTITNYTFLQSDIQQLPSTLGELLLRISLKPETKKCIQNYLKQLENKKYDLIQIQQYEIHPNVLTSPVVSWVSKIFSELKLGLEEELNQVYADKKLQAEQVSYIAAALNIVDFKIWNKIIMYGCETYKSMDIQQQNLFLLSVSKYLEKFLYMDGFKIKNKKFSIRQTHMQDVVDFNYFIKATCNDKIFKNSKINQNQVMQLALGFQYQPQQTNIFGSEISWLRNRMRLIKKISKSVDLNFYSIRQQFIALVPSIIEHADFLGLQFILEIYNFYSSISIYHKQLIKTMQNHILSGLLSKPLQENRFGSLRLIKQILSTWKNQSRYNQQIYYPIILPFLQTMLEKVGSPVPEHQQMFWSNILFSLICCGLGSTQLPSQIVHKIGPSNYKTLKISEQYLRILKLKESGKNLHTQMRKLIESQKQETSKIQAIEYNPIQEFWYRNIKIALPSQNVYHSQMISSFQVDILVHYKGRYFAFEIQGNHYKHNNKDIRFIGKKKIKKQILSVYGITIVFINCEEVLPKAIMRFQKVKDAQKYIIDLLQAQIKNNPNNKQNKVSPNIVSKLY